METWAGVRGGSLVYEDEGMLALNKPPGISVTGERHDTDLVEMAAEAGERLYPVHRIDKVTSGVVLFAKDVAHHGPLTRQFNRQTVDKAYLVVTRSTGLPESGAIDLPLSVGRKNRVRIAGAREDIGYDAAARRWSLRPGAELPGKKNYPSLTTFVRVARTDTRTFLVVRPVSGRRHQIRVHLAWTGHPIEGDPLFDRQSAESGALTCLHSWRLALDAAWARPSRVLLEAEPPAAFWEAFGGDGGELSARAKEALALLPGAGTAT
ncbi:RluA family pseudouridine synthase [Streptomyces sp. NPDC050560]|uniref:RluA family pseudouridine synthase n=1 Tax=Streptomyces sp. NPDC050560 TaxID=3365630 RepID=UPI0037A04421